MNLNELESMDTMAFSIQKKHRLFINQSLVLSIILLLAIIPLAFPSVSAASNATWELLPPEYPDAVFRDVYFANATHGWIVGNVVQSIPSDIIVLHTNDAGISWNALMTKPDQFTKMVEVVDGNILWVTSLDGAYYSLDGGNVWNSSRVGDSGASTIRFVNRTHGWASSSGILYKTNNTGFRWSEVAGWSFDDTFLDMKIQSPQEFWAIGFSGTYRSHDGGETWNKVCEEGGWTIAVTGDDEAWAVGDNRLAHTTDGDNWEELSIPQRGPTQIPRFQPPYLSDVIFLDSNNGWIVGMEIPFMHTSDGGQNWYEQSVSEEITSSRINEIHMINETHGWAVGSDGRILMTTRGDSLETWLWTDGSSFILGIVGISLVSILIVTIFAVRYHRRKKRDNSNRTVASSVY